MIIAAITTTTATAAPIIAPEILNGFFSFAVLEIPSGIYWYYGSALFLLSISIVYYMNRNKEDQNIDIQ